MKITTLTALIVCTVWPAYGDLKSNGNIVNTIESSGEPIKRQSQGTHHLIATAWNPVALAPAR